MRYVALIVAAVLVACLLCRSQQPSQQRDLKAASERMQFVADALDRSADELERGEPLADVVTKLRWFAHTMRQQMDDQP